jgi:hypothetical protein
VSIHEFIMATELRETIQASGVALQPERSLEQLAMHIANGMAMKPGAAAAAGAISVPPPPQQQRVMQPSQQQYSHAPPTQQFTPAPSYAQTPAPAAAVRNSFAPIHPSATFSATSFASPAPAPAGSQPNAYAYQHQHQQQQQQQYRAPSSNPSPSADRMLLRPSLQSAPSYTPLSITVPSSPKRSASPPLLPAEQYQREREQQQQLQWQMQQQTLLYQRNRAAR